MIRVTGASGFIGKAVLDYCKRKDLPSVGYTRSSHSSNSGLVVVDDYRDVPGDGYLIHLGEHNIVNTITSEVISLQIEVADALSRKPFEKIVYASSAAVYAPSQFPIEVDSLNFSQSIYAQGKLDCERCFIGSGHIVARISNVYGPFMSQNNVLATVLSQRQQPLIKVQNIKPVRDYIWIEDVAEALVTMALSSHSGVFNVSTGVGSSVKHLIEVICQVSGNLNYRIDEIQPGSGNSIILDSSQTTTRIGWRPQTDLYSGILKLIGSLK